jgi:hypothetical protein
LPFIIKYDTDGEVLWANQAYAINDPSTEVYNFMVWHDNYVDNSGVYLMGQAGSSYGQDPLFYFDNETNYLPLLPNTYQHASFFVKFDKETGAFNALGKTPGLHTFVASSSRPTTINNHFLGLFLYDFSLGSLLNYFNTNGQFIKADTIICSDANRIAGKIVATEVGSIVCDFVVYQDMNFDQNITLNFDDHQHSHAVIALRYDPSILEPYPVDSTAVPQYDERLSEIRLYPNPATDCVVIESPEGLPVGMVAVTNESGQLLFLQPATSCRTEISVRDLPSGLYVAHVSTSVGSTAIKFVVRN